MGLEQNLNNISGVSSIQFSGRSGSYLLSNLFDSHPNILSCPPHSLHNALKHLNHILHANSLKKTVKVEQFAQSICDKFPCLFVLSDQNKEMHEKLLGKKSANAMKYGVNQGRFLTYLTDYLYFLIKQKIFTISNVFKCIHLAYAECLDKEILPNSWIVWQQHGIFCKNSLSIIEQTFQNFLFLTTIRQPIKAIDSHLKHIGFNQKSIMIDKPDFPKLILRLFAEYGVSITRKEILYDTSSLYKFPQYLVRFEDMHLKTERLMTILLGKMNLPFDENTLKTTIDGNDYLFENNGKLITGTRDSLEGENILYIFRVEDDLLLKKIFKKINKQFGYEQILYHYESDRDTPHFSSVLRHNDALLVMLQKYATVKIQSLQELLNCG